MLNEPIAEKPRWVQADNGPRLPSPTSPLPGERKPKQVSDSAPFAGDGDDPSVKNVSWQLGLVFTPVTHIVIRTKWQERSMRENQNLRSSPKPSKAVFPIARVLNNVFGSHDNLQKNHQKNTRTTTLRTHWYLVPFWLEPGWTFMKNVENRDNVVGSNDNDGYDV